MPIGVFGAASGPDEPDDNKDETRHPPPPGSSKEEYQGWLGRVGKQAEKWYEKNKDTPAGKRVRESRNESKSGPKSGKRK